MSYPRVQFVSAPSPDADVRFNCNSAGEWSDDDRWPEHDGFTLGFPSLAGDPEAIGVQYGVRSIEFNLIVRATPDAAFNVFARLSREVQRPRNWLMVQFSDFSKPVWFYTYRTEQQALDFENVSGVKDTKKNVWGIGVRLAADPFAQGERITLPAVTVSNNPFAAGGCVVSLPAIVGDAPAPAALQIQSSIDWNGYTPQLSHVALDGGPYDGTPVPFSLAGATLSTDASAAIAASTAPGGQKVPVTFATNNNLTVRVIDATTVLPVGVYRVLVWAERASVGDTFRLQGTHSRGGATISGDSVDFNRSASPGGSTGHASWVDLGEFSFPAFASMDDRTSVYLLGANFWVSAQRLTGSGSLNLAALLYVPVDTPWAESGRLMSAAFGTPGLTGNRTAEWDEDGNYTMLVTSSLPTRSVYDAPPPQPVGGLPSLVPGCTNTITLLQQTNPHTPADPTVDNRDKIAASATVTVSYAPRYLNLAGSEVL